MRHYYNEMDGALMQAERQAQAARLNQVNDCGSELERYSSPYRVKVVKEVAKQRKEEVDLETGKRKSWVETTEFEVLDLTGETPVRKPRLNLSNSPLKEVNNGKEINKDQNNSVKRKLPEIAKPDPGTCPVCGRKFKGEKGVNSHRRARNSACHPDKENQNMNQANQNKEPSSAVTPVTRRNLVTSTTPQSQDDSIIIIPDTPLPGNRRVSLRRSIRMA